MPRWLGCLGVLVIAFGAMTAMAAPVAYVANPGTGTISVIDTDTKSVTTTIGVRGSPIQIVLSADGTSTRTSSPSSTREQHRGY